MKRTKEQCRSPSNGKTPVKEQLSERDIRELMAHDSYERTAGGAIRSRRRLVVLK